MLEYLSRLNAGTFARIAIVAVRTVLAVLALSTAHVLGFFFQVPENLRTVAFPDLHLSVGAQFAFHFAAAVVLARAAIAVVGSLSGGLLLRLVALPLMWTGWFSIRKVYESVKANESFAYGPLFYLLVAALFHSLYLRNSEMDFWTKAVVAVALISVPLSFPGFVVSPFTFVRRLRDGKRRANQISAAAHAAPRIMAAATVVAFISGYLHFDHIMRTHYVLRDLHVSHARGTGDFVLVARSSSMTLGRNVDEEGNPKDFFILGPDYSLFDAKRKFNKTLRVEPPK